MDIDKFVTDISYLRQTRKPYYIWNKQEEEILIKAISKYGINNYTLIQK